MNWLWVAAGGAIGAPLRYLTDCAVRARYGSAFPWGTLLVNTVGSLLLGGLTGLVAGALEGRTVGLLLGTGLCGALTTYSTFSYETLRMAERGKVALAAVNVAVSCVVCLGALTAGLAVGRVWAG